jgi:AraC-like DNA-binding protein
MSMKKIHCILFSVLAFFPVIIIISVIIHTSVNTLSIFPSEKYNAIGWWPHANEESVIHSLYTTQRKIEFEYTLNGSPAYAGFGIFLDQNYPFLDLSKYTRLTVKISASEARHFGVIIRTFEKGITQLKDGNYEPLRYCQIRTEILNNSDTYSIALSKFKVPDWWITLYAPPGKALDPDPFIESAIMQFFFDDTELLGKKDRVEVYEITFHSSSDFLWIIVAVGTVCYYILFGSILILPRLRRNIENNRGKLLSSYKRIDQVNYWKKDAEVVRSYISEHYNNPDISLNLIATEVGMSQKRIKDIISGEYEMNFKTCITWLRIQEAKRLLTETGLNITEIAFGLGFSTNSYFGLIFKRYEGLSPKEYREKYSPAK